MDGKQPPFPGLPYGRGVARPISEPLVGKVGEGEFGRGRGFLMPISEPTVGMGRGAVPAMDVKRPDKREEMPALQSEEPEVVPMTTKVDVPGLGSSLVSMFRGMGIEPGKSWGRGAAPIGRGSVGDFGAGVQSKMSTVGASALHPEKEEQPVSFLGRGFVGLGRTVSSHMGVGRGPTSPMGLMSPISAPLSLASKPYVSEDAPAPPGTPPKAEVTTETVGFLGRGFVGLGRTPLPHIGVGRGPTSPLGRVSPITTSLSLPGAPSVSEDVPAPPGTPP